MKIYRIFPVVLLVFIGSVVFFACKKKDDQSRLQASWSSKDPIAIPFNVRNHQRSLGNLVINPSFETGKIYYEESNVKSYDIAGWKKVGNNIKWINSDNGEFDSNEVYEGNHAIKIERKSADETEITGDGIISDFIKVIPGNYSLKLFLKLENVCPNQARIGTKIYDAVNIRLQYFDKNKIEITGNEFDAFQNKKIDNTFKSLTLSNFWNIEEFGWGEVHGKTANFPFFNGDIPDEARYVKIYIGLKGTGKMWIDNIDFHYTADNFTVLERLKPYFDSSYLATDLVYPQPKHITKKSSFKFLNKDSVKYPIIVISDKADKKIEELASKLKTELISKIIKSDNTLLPNIEIVNKVEQETVSKNQMIISIGNNQLYQNNSNSLPDSLISEHKSAYYIYSLAENDNVVFINAADHKAFKYAINSFLQLFDFNNATYFGADIVDYPDFEERALLIHHFDRDIASFKKTLNLFKQFKFSQLYFEWYGDNNSNYYPSNSLNEFLDENNIDYSFMIDVNNQIDKKINTNSFSKSVNSVLVYNDYFQKSEFCNSDLNVKNDQLDYFSDFNKLGINIEYLPPWNRLDIIDQSHGEAEFYFRDLKRTVSENVTMYWMGSSHISKSIDFAEWKRINNIYNTSPVLLDNSLLGYNERFKIDYIKGYYAGKIRVLSLFESYNCDLFNDFYQSGGRKVLLNTNNLSELNAISILSAANYYWNTESYNPDKSLWIVLNKLYGRENAIKLLQFNDAYFGLNEICQKMETDGLQFKNVRIAKNFESELNNYFNELKNSIDNTDLLAEIEKLTIEILKKYNELTSSVK
ncbi:beta-N-acetylglucosaminidase domain-containing protein [Bacteroidota bacterium]